MSGHTVTPVQNKRQLDEFLRVPFRLYSSNPYWVPQLLSQQRAMFDPRHFPFHFHSKVQCFLCSDGSGKTLGRICAILNRRHLEFHRDGVGFFGFFDCTDNFEAANSLFEAASQWLKAEGCTIIRGPANFSTNEDCGLLVEGFDSTPLVMMPYNFQYYAELVEKAGFKKAMDLYAYSLDGTKETPERLVRAGELLKRKYKASVRTLDFKNLTQEMEVLFNIYNAAWEKNWGFVPMTREEFFFSAKDLSQIADRDIVFVLEVDGEPVGFSLTLPDINIPLLHMNGRLLPFGWLKFLIYRKKINWVRIFAMGLLKEHRGKGIDALMYLETFKTGQRKGYTHAEISWVLEINRDMIAAAEKMGASHYKTYRLYEREL